MHPSTPVIVSSVFPQTSLITRESALLLASVIEGAGSKTVNVDFSGIVFISRSFADQFYKEQMRLLQELQIEAVVVNAQHDVQEMFKVVSKTQNKTERGETIIPTVHFQTRRALKEFLYSF